MNLLIDMGNSRLKWAMTTAGQIMPGLPLANEQINRQALVALWKGIYRPRRVAISCVGSTEALELVQTIAHELWLDIDIILVKPQAQAFGVTNAYRHPEKLGVDRWLCLVAVWQQYQSPACIVDCGTAMTVDLINADGKHQGGLICPGLALMKKSLGQATEALPISETKYPVALANDTEAAIYSGVLMAATGVIEQVMSSQPADTRLILTGGDAGLIAEQLDYAITLDPDLVLRGLLCVLEGHP